MAQLTSRPLPQRRRSESRESYRASIASEVGDLAAAYEQVTRDLDTLTPPERYRELHAGTRGFFEVSAADNRRWAEALRSGDRKKADEVARANQAAELEAARKWKRAADALGEKVPQLEQLLTELEDPKE